jgi:dTDP-4-amino-4,6-dideoxygalactose transaminase
VDKYTWVDVGSSYLPSDILAATLFAQLEVRDVIQAQRRRLWERYRDGLASWALENGVGLPYVPAHCEQAYHMFYLLLPNLETRTALIKHLKKRDILSVFHYVPLHLSYMGLKFGGRPGQCPVTEDVSDRLLRLPMFSALSHSDQDRVLEGVYEFPFPRHKSARAAGGRW